MTYEDGTVGISVSVYRCLVGALRKIAAGRDTCCSERARRLGKHSPSCAVGIALAAFQEADKLNSLPNSVLDRYDPE
jgi:hypothetical protein